MDHDVFYQQLDRLAQRLDSKGPQMIDPVEFGEIKGAVDSLKLQMTEVKQRQANIDQKLDLVLDKLSEAKGGWRVMMWVGGAFATVGAGFSWVVDHMVSR